MVRPLTVRTIEEMLEREAAAAVPFGATVVYVSGSFKPPTVDALHRMSTRGHPVMPVWVGHGEAPSAAGMQVLDARRVFGVSEPEDAFKRPGNRAGEAQPGKVVHA
jgi:hypothetical protein